VFPATAPSRHHEVSFDYGIAIGSYVKSNAANALVFGTGSSGSFLTNSKANSLMFGVNQFPSLTIVKPDGADLGYVGIGTEDPKEMAHVVGKVLIERTTDVASSLRFKHPNKKDIGLPPPEPQLAPYYWDIYSDTYGLKFNTTTSNGIETQRMMISQGGSVGIGIDAPKAQLHVNKNILAEGNITTLNNFVFAPEYNADSEYWEISRTGEGLNYAYMDQRLQDVLFLGNDGSIGVGTTDPLAMLDVNGAFKAESATLSGALTAQSATINGNANITGTITGGALSVNNATINGDADISGSITAGGDLSAESANIAGNTYISGNVGIGISSTTHKLHVVGNTFLNGNVGIGKAPTQRKLDVNGDIAAQGTFVLNEGTPYCTSFGSAYSSLLNFGSSYIGFNATRNNGNWALAGDGANNGGGVIYTNVWGEMYFASIPSTGANPQTLTDAQVKSNIKLSLSANGKLRAKEITVSLAGWPDYVFEENYNLLPLVEVEQYIKQNSRLPQVPSAQEIEENGLDLGDMQGKLLLKIEELTLYIIDLEKRLSEIESKKGGE